MRHATRLAILLGLLAAATAATAATHTVTWTNPTARTDGVALPAAQIASTRVEHSTCNGTAFVEPSAGSNTVTGAATSLQFTTTGVYGPMCVRAFTLATDGSVSAPSNVSIKTIPSSPPNPPVLTTVTTVAYVLKPSFWGLIRMARVAGVTLPLGVPCDTALPGLPGFGVLGEYLALCAPG